MSYRFRHSLFLFYPLSRRICGISERKNWTGRSTKLLLRKR